MFEAITSPYLVPFDGTFRCKDAATQGPRSSLNKKDHKKRLDELVLELETLQRMLYAGNNIALLLIFQAMDAAGKDSTIRAVMSGVNPAGCQIYSFKQPSAEELDHDFLWRTSQRLPERGRIGIFNRSYYEEVLIVRVHPENLATQRLPWKMDTEQLWQHRLESILDHEKHLARNGTVVIKFWLNISKKEQRRRFLSRIDEPEKNWKFATSDIVERSYWNDYMNAYQHALATTSKPWAPWYAIPADDKPYMRACIADIIVSSLRSLGLTYPRIGAKEQETLATMRNLLENE